MSTKEIIQKLCVQNGITVSALEKELGFSNGSLKKDGSFQSDRLLKVAQRFGVTMEYLMGIENENGRRIIYVGNPYVPGSIDSALKKNEEIKNYYSQNRSFNVEITMNGETLFSKKIDGASYTPEDYFNFHNRIDNLDSNDLHMVRMLSARLSELQSVEYTKVSGSEIKEIK